MNGTSNELNKLKNSVIAELRNVSLTKKDRIFLLTLIELFDWLSENESERFLPKLEKLALEKNINEDEEFAIRLYSLKTQLDSSKTLKTIHFPTISLYFQTEKVDIYIKKLPASWNDLINEITKIEFDYMLVYVYKTAAKKSKLLSTKIKKSDKESWKDALIKILDIHIHTNVKIVLFYKKLEL